MSVFVLVCFCLSLYGWKHTSINIRGTGYDIEVGKGIILCSCDTFTSIDRSIEKAEV